MSSTRSGYRELGLELVSLEETTLLCPRNLPWWGKRKMRIGDPFKMLLKESLE
jgi:hypothetical protein